MGVMVHPSEMAHVPEKHVCEHLLKLEEYLASLGIRIKSSGQVWSMNCRFWIYFDAVLDCDALRKRFELPDFVTVSQNDDPRSGREKGLYCETHQDALMGTHPLDGGHAKVVT
jgi:hypothetical protein